MARSVEITRGDRNVMESIYGLQKASGKFDQEKLRKRWEKFWLSFGLDSEDTRADVFFLSSDDLLDGLGKDVGDESLEWLRQELDHLGDYSITISDNTGMVLETQPFMMDTIGYYDERGGHILAKLFCPELVGTAIRMVRSAQMVEAAAMAEPAR